MYLHIGNGAVLHDGDIVGVFDMDRSTAQKATVDCLNRAQKEGRIIEVGTEFDLPKAFVVCAPSLKSRSAGNRRGARRGGSSKRALAASDASGPERSGAVFYITPISSQTLLKRSGLQE